MTNPILKRAKGHNVAINIAAWEGKAGPILCIHGITANCRCWDALAHSLSPAYRVLAMDLRGRGRSEKPATGYSLKKPDQSLPCERRSCGR